MHFDVEIEIYKMQLIRKVIILSGNKHTQSEQARAREVFSQGAILKFKSLSVSSSPSFSQVNFRRHHLFWNI